MPVAEAAAAAKVRGASGRGLLGRDSRQRGVLAAVVRLRFWQAECHFPKPGTFSEFRRILAYFSRFLRFARIFAEFLRFTAAGHFALDALVIVLGLTFRFLTSFCEFLFYFAAFFLTNRYISRAEPRATIEMLHTCSVGCWETMNDLKLFELAS